MRLPLPRPLTAFMLLSAYYLPGCGESPVGSYEIDYSATIALRNSSSGSGSVWDIESTQKRGTRRDLVVGDDGTFSLITTFTSGPSDIWYGTWTPSEDRLILLSDRGYSWSLHVSAESTLLEDEDGNLQVFRRTLD